MLDENGENGGLKSALCVYNRVGSDAPLKRGYAETEAAEGMSRRAGEPGDEAVEPPPEVQ